MAIIQITIILYHHYFQDILSLNSIFYQWREGGIFALSNLSLWWHNYLWLILLLTIGNVIIFCRFIAKLPKDYFVLGLLFLLNLLWTGTISYTKESDFDKTIHQRLATDFGYTYAWEYEYLGSRNKSEALNIIRQNRHNLPRVSPSKPYNLSQNIYFIQIESWAYDVLHKTYQGKEITPFLNDLSKKYPTYRVTGKPKGASSNTDFFINAGSFALSDYGALYNIFSPQELYQDMKLLPQMAKEKGYYPVFFHNFSAEFFNRSPHIKAQGYQQQFFNQDMAKNRKIQLEDGQMFDFVLQYQQKNSAKKLFNYIITMSAHADYKVKDNLSPLIKSPQNTLEDYYNAINYDDRVLQKFIKQLPKDSLVFLYGDHGVYEFSYFSAGFIIYDRLNHLNYENREMKFPEFVARVRSYLE